MRLGFVVLVLVAACGDNFLPDGDPLAPADNLTIIAHQDDDLIFMQPDIIDLVGRGAGLTNVYVTAGNGTKGYEYAESREVGLMAAYGSVVNARLSDWRCGWITIAEHPAEHCRLDQAKLSLVFLGYPDGGKYGEYAESLLKLWEAKITTATTVSRKPSKYTQGELIAAIAEIATTSQPKTLRTLDVASTHGRDHIDHMVVASLALLGIAQAQVAPAIISYRAYNVEDEPVDKIDALFDPESQVVAHYDACVDGCAACGDACPSISEAHATWLNRRYAIGFRKTATAQLVLDGMCLSFVPDGTTTLGDCAGAPVWTFTAAGAITSSDGHCLQTLPTGELVAATCSPGDPVTASNRFFLDDESHIWSGVPPAAVDGMDYKHANCLVSSGGHARAALCGEGAAPAWTIQQPLKGGQVMPGTAFDARLADIDGDGKADFVYLDASGLAYIAGSGDGTFGTDAVAFGPVGVAGSALAVGDVDGDGKPDVCWLDATGVQCALAAESYSTADAWSTDMTDASASTVESLAIVQNHPFGLALCAELAGAVCETKGGSQVVLSSWPAGDPLWFGDLDGDQVIDWCAATPTGPACNVSSEIDATRLGVPWAFAQNGTLDAATLAPQTTALGDIDGDGLADLCAIDGDHVSCTRSSRHGFGPRLALAPLTGDTLILGDLDGDGHADACTLDGTTLHCALSP